MGPSSYVDELILVDEMQIEKALYDRIVSHAGIGTARKIVAWVHVPDPAHQRGASPTGNVIRIQGGTRSEPVSIYVAKRWAAWLVRLDEYLPVHVAIDWPVLRDYRTGEQHRAAIDSVAQLAGEDMVPVPACLGGGYVPQLPAVDVVTAASYSHAGILTPDELRRSMGLGPTCPAFCEPLARWLESAGLLGLATLGPASP